MTKAGLPRRYIEEVVLPYAGRECLLWPFGKNQKGYGQILVDGRKCIASRVVCGLVNGPAPSPEYEAAHSCGKGHLGCVAGGHLSWKTAAENNADKRAHGTHRQGAEHGRAKLKESDVRKILALKGEMSQRLIGLRFGVTQEHVGDIHRGKRWQCLETRI